MKLSELKIEVKCPKCEFLLTHPNRMPCCQCTEINKTTGVKNCYVGKNTIPKNT